MKSLISTTILLISLAVGACSSNVSVKAPMISATEFGSQSKTPGSYAVWLQSGAWKTTVEARGFTCSGWDFPTDFDNAYQQAAQSAFRSSFEKVTFTPGTLRPEDLVAQKYDAQIVVYQGGIKSAFGVDTGFFTNTMQAEVKMDGIVAVIGHSGLTSQGAARGSGSGVKNSAIGCGSVGDAIMQAGGVAIKDFVIASVDAAKLNVLESKAKDSAGSQRISRLMDPPNSADTEH